MNLVDIKDLKIGDSIGWLNFNSEKKENQCSILKLKSVETMTVSATNEMDGMQYTIDSNLFLIIRPDNPHFAKFLSCEFGKDKTIYKDCNVLFLHKGLLGNFARLSAPLF